MLWYTVDLGACLQRAGYSPAGMPVTIGIHASDKTRDNVVQMVRFRLPNS